MNSTIGAPRDDALEDAIQHLLMEAGSGAVQCSADCLNIKGTASKDAQQVRMFEERLRVEAAKNEYLVHENYSLKREMESQRCTLSQLGMETASLAQENYALKREMERFSHLGIEVGSLKCEVDEQRCELAQLRTLVESLKQTNYALKGQVEGLNMTPRRGIGAYIQFLINNQDRVLVVGECWDVWVLSSGRVAKKKNEGSNWIWAQDDVRDNSAESSSHSNIGLCSCGPTPLLLDIDGLKISPQASPTRGNMAKNNHLHFDGCPRHRQRQQQQGRPTAYKGAIGNSSRENHNESSGKSRQLNQSKTVSPLEECKPLLVDDEELAGKAKVMRGRDDHNMEEETETVEGTLRKATLILNKLSLEKFDKLSDEFVNCGIGRDIETLSGAVGLIVQYAQKQHNFSPTYARLCRKIAVLRSTRMKGMNGSFDKKGEMFKELLLQRCQTEFAVFLSADADAKGRSYQADMNKELYLGHLRFMGELYKCGLISIETIMMCLSALLERKGEDVSNYVYEGRVECFVVLMTVVGSSLERCTTELGLKRNCNGNDNVGNSLALCWDAVKLMAGRRQEKSSLAQQVSHRTKLMLQDLLWMKEKGWASGQNDGIAITAWWMQTTLYNKDDAIFDFIRR